MYISSTNSTNSLVKEMLAKGEWPQTEHYLYAGYQTAGRGQTGNSLAANRAYIKYSELVYSTPSPAPGRRVRAIPMQDQSTTGVENLNAAEAPVKTVIDGKMYILRGEHMFDATGRMVK